MLFFLIYSFYLTCVLPARIYMYHVYAWCLRRPEGDFGSPELQLERVGSHHAGTEGTEPGSSRRATSALNYGVLSLA